MANKRKEIAGVLIYYFATGEHGRPQFIGHNCLDDKGLIKGHEEIYDVEIGDEIQLLHSNFSIEWLPVKDDTYNFLAYLSAMWRDSADLKVNIRPHNKHRSWGYVIAKDKKKKVRS